MSGLSTGLYASQYEWLSYGLNPLTNYRHSAEMAGNSMQHSPWGATRSQLVYRLTARCGTRLFVPLLITAATGSMIPVLLPYFYVILCILIVRPCILNIFYVFLLLSMYSYCSSMYYLSVSMYSYCCLSIFRRGYPDWDFFRAFSSVVRQMHN